MSEDSPVETPTIIPDDQLTETLVKLSDDSLDKLKIEAEERGIDEALLFEQWIRESGEGFFMLDVEESVVTLKAVDPWSSEDTKLNESGTAEARIANRKVYRRLRDKFPPIKAGVEYAKSFSSGGGFTVDIDDINDKLQEKNRKIIRAFNRNVFQDIIVRGLPAILDIMLDETLTVGASAAEIVYVNELDSNLFIGTPLDIADYPLDNTRVPEFETKEPNDKQWKKLGGVAQLKIIDDAKGRIIPYRNPQTYKIEYWTVDEYETNKLNKERKSKNLQPIEKKILLPWQVLWLPWSIRGTDVGGHSIIEGVAEIGLLLEQILAAVGLSFKKWSDTKYFFILGTKDGRTWAPPKVRQFLHDVRKMTSSGGTGIAVPAGFDIKEVGGQVFEGGRIIDYLMTLITTGMSYPKTFLEQGGSNEGDQAWMAWIRTYSNYQNILTTTIEAQLWERHLNCIVGTTQEVAKQGVKASRRSKIKTYIPKMTWRSDGKWQTATKVEQQTKVLNVANPIDMALKLQVEKDISITFGYTEIDWSYADKMLVEQQKLLLTDASIETLKAEMLLEALEQAQEDKLHLDMNPQLRGLSAPKEEGEEDGAVQDTGQDKDEDKPLTATGTTNPKRPKPVPGARQDGGVSRTTKKTGTDNKKGQSKPVGGSRQAKPKSVGETVEEIEEVEVDEIEESVEPIHVPQPQQPQKVELEITVKQENTPQEIVIKSDPLKISTEPIEVKTENTIVVEKEKDIDGQRDSEFTNNIKMEGRIARIVDERMRKIDSIVDRVKVLEIEREEFNEMQESEKGKTDLELKRKKIEFMEQWMKENPDESIEESEKGEDDEQ